MNGTGNAHKSLIWTNPPCTLTCIHIMPVFRLSAAGIVFWCIGFRGNPARSRGRTELTTRNIHAREQFMFSGAYAGPLPELKTISIIYDIGWRCSRLLF